MTQPVWLMVQEDLVTQSDSYIPFGVIAKAAKMPEQGDLQYLQIFCKVPYTTAPTSLMVTLVPFHDNM